MTSNSGRLLWRQIEGALKQSIIAGEYAPGSRLPPDRQIAERFGATRVTARRALAALEQQGLIRIEHGSGTFVADNMVRYSVGKRVRFNQNLAASNAKPRRDLVSAMEVKASPVVATRLRVAIGDAVLKLSMIGYADDAPISVTSRYAPADRFYGLATSFERTESFTEALKEFGVMDFRRKFTEVTARLPTPMEARLLKQPKTQAVLACESVDVDVEDIPISCQIGCFAGDRVALLIGEDD